MHAHRPPCPIRPTDDGHRPIARPRERLRLALLLAAGAALAGIPGCGGESTSPPIDGGEPLAVHDLAGSPAGGERVRLTWTAPADEAPAGAAAAAYDLRWRQASWPLDWGEAPAVVQHRIPRNPGVPETLTVHGLEVDTLYAFALRSRDAEGHWSEWSNETQVRPRFAGCTMTADTLEFGEVEIGASTERSFQIRSLGPGPLDGFVHVVCIPYSITRGGGSFRLEEGQTKSVTVRFRPDVEGPIECEVETGAGCGPVVCRGIGVRP